MIYNKQTQLKDSVASARVTIHGSSDEQICFGFWDSKRHPNGYDVYIEQSHNYIPVMWTADRYRAQALFCWLDTKTELIEGCMKQNQQSLKKVLLAARFVQIELSYRQRGKAVELIDVYVQQNSEE